MHPLSSLNFTYNFVINGYLSIQKIGFNVFYVFMFLEYLIRLEESLLLLYMIHMYMTRKDFIICKIMGPYDKVVIE